MNSRRQMQGFTLIELMIVVAIMGILAAMAISQYQNYTVRTRVSEVITAAGSVKVTMSEEYLSSGAFPAAGDAILAELQAAFAGTDYVAAAADAVYTPGNPAQWQVTLNNLNPAVDGDNLVFFFNGAANGVRMSCNGGNISAQYRPAECR